MTPPRTLPWTAAQRGVAGRRSWRIALALATGRLRGPDDRGDSCAGGRRRADDHPVAVQGPAAVRGRRRERTELHVPTSRPGSCRADLHAYLDASYAIAKWRTTGASMVRALLAGAVRLGVRPSGHPPWTSSTRRSPARGLITDRRGRAAMRPAQTRTGAEIEGTTGTARRRGGRSPPCSKWTCSMTHRRPAARPAAPRPASWPLVCRGRRGRTGARPGGGPPGGAARTLTLHRACTQETVARIERRWDSRAPPPCRMDERLPWFREMSAENRSWVGLVAQAGHRRVRGLVQAPGADAGRASPARYSAPRRASWRARCACSRPSRWSG